MSQLLSNLEVGSKVKFGKYQVESETPEPIVWTIVAKNHVSEPAYPANSVTLHASEILDLRCFDAKEPNNTDADRQSYGNNRYSISNLDQWLNKNAAANAWYAATHSADQPPDRSSVYANTQYASRPGFLNGFTTDEINAILSTTIRVVKPVVDGSSYEDIQRKVFLPSNTEVGLSNENSIAEGSAWGYYTSNSARIGYLTQQCFGNTLSNTKPSSEETGWYWWLRTPRYDDPNDVWSVKSDGSGLYGYFPYRGQIGVRPALNLSTSLLVSDSTDSDGCYTFVWATTAPDSITVPELNAGASASVSWSEAQNAVGYILERSVDGSDFTEVYRGSETVYTDMILSTWNTAQYRVCAYDGDSNTSEYTASAVISVNKLSVDLLSAIRNHAEQYIKLIFDDGTVVDKSDISSSEGGFILTEVLNGDNDMTVGRAVSSQVEATLFNDSGKFTDFDFSQEFELQFGVKVGESVETISVGKFKGERPEKVRGRLIDFTAYDRMVKFDISAEEFILGLTFPATLGGIFQNLCAFVGVNTVTSTFINSDKQFSVNPFTNSDYTAREVLSWIAEAACAYARMNSEGKVELVWYASKSHTILRSDRFEMSESEFMTPQIGKLEVYNSYGDQLVTAGTGSNTYVISDNPFLYIENDTEIEGLQPFVNQIYNRLLTFPEYHPASLRAEWYPEIRCGDIVSVVNDYGDTIVFPIFSQTLRWNGFGITELENTGGITREIAPIRQRELEELKKNMLRTTDLYTSISSYLNSQEGKASITSAVGGEFVKISDGSLLTATNEIEQLVQSTEDGINNKISLTAGVGKGTIGSKVQAMLTLFANTDTSEISLAANAISLTASGGGSSTEETEVGDISSIISGVDYGFEKTSDGYWTSTNHGIANSFSYAYIDFEFTESTQVKLSCISYGESDYDFGIISTLDSRLNLDYKADTANVLRSFKGESSSAVKTVTLTVPSGSHYISIKYIKNSSNNSGGDYFKIKATVMQTTTSKTQTLKLSSKGITLSSADINFEGTVTFSDLSTAGKTVINGANVTTTNLHVENVFFKDNNYTIATSEMLDSSTGIVSIGVQDTDSQGWANLLNLYGSIITLGNHYNDTDAIQFNIGQKMIVPADAGVWDIGTSNDYFRYVYAERYYFSNDSYLRAMSGGTLRYYKSDGTYTDLT